MTSHTINHDRLLGLLPKAVNCGNYVVFKEFCKKVLSRRCRFLPGLCARVRFPDDSSIHQAGKNTEMLTTFSQRFPESARNGRQTHGGLIAGLRNI
jgi:hypothetical protein